MNYDVEEMMAIAFWKRTKVPSDPVWRNLPEKDKQDIRSAIRAAVNVAFEFGAIVDVGNAPSIQLSRFNAFDGGWSYFDYREMKWIKGFETPYGAIDHAREHLKEADMQCSK